MAKTNINITNAILNQIGLNTHNQDQFITLHNFNTIKTNVKDIVKFKLIEVLFSFLILNSPYSLKI